MYFHKEILTIGLLGFLVFSNGQRPGKLPSFNVFEKRITLSGFSSGGTFAQQFQFSYSSLIHGVAVFSHTFYRCGSPAGLVDEYDKNCTKLWNATESEFYDTNLVHTDIQNYFAKGYIEDPTNLRNKRLYVYTGLRNSFFSPVQTLNILKVYERYIRNPERIMTRVQDVQFVMPTNNNYGLPCTQDAMNRTLIGNCGFSGAFEALGFLHGSDHDMREEPQANPRKYRDQLRTFDQTEFVTGLNRHYMDTEGFYFVPKKCERHKCLIHFFFHGCLTGRELVGRTFIENCGYLEVGDSIGMIMVFPQALTSLPNNEIGCWDTFGIGGPLYATNRGPQTIAVKRMMDRVLGKSAPLSGSVHFGASQQSTTSRPPSKHGQYGSYYWKQKQHSRP